MRTLRTKTMGRRFKPPTRAPLCGLLYQRRCRRLRKLRGIQVRGPLVEEGTLTKEARLENGWGDR